MLPLTNVASIETASHIRRSGAMFLLQIYILTCYMLQLRVVGIVIWANEGGKCMR